MHDINRSWALRYAETGISVFPCKADATKIPLIKWRAGSTTDAGTIAGWWNRWPNSFVGIDLHKCGLVVLDADRHDGGADGVAAVNALFRDHGADLSGVPITHTPGNGYHFYFRQPKGEPLGNREGDLPDGVNVRGAGGLTIAPYCVRPDGKSYRGVAAHPDLMTAFQRGTIPVIPGWLVEIIQPPPRSEPIAITKQRGHRFDRYAAAALERMAKELAAKPRDTGRNNDLNLMAWKMGTMVARGWIGQPEVEQVLLQAADACNLAKDTGARGVRATIGSGLKAGLLHPHPDLRNR
jgi:hypothetical protein